MKKNITNIDFIIITTTIVLFVVALFVKGLTKELMLETGVLLVSIKLIMMNYKTGIANKKISKQLDDIQSTLDKIKKDKL